MPPKSIPTPSFTQVAAQHAQLPSELSEEEKESLEEAVDLDSTMLETVYYEPDTETLVAIFNNGDTGEYPCSVAQYRGLLAAPSAGKYMWSNFL